MFTKKVLINNLINDNLLINRIQNSPTRTVKAIKNVSSKLYK